MPRLSKRYKKRLEFHINGIEKFSLYEHAKYRRFPSVFGMINHIYGKINFAKSVDHIYGKRIENKFTNIIQQNGLC